MTDRNTISQIVESLFEDWIDKNINVHPLAVENMRILEADALALLKEAKTQGADSGMCEICSFYERALPVKPHYNARTNWYECGACHFSMTSGMHCRGELIPAYKVGFCAKCGRKQEWE